MNVGNMVSYYVNPNNRTLTTNLKNTAILDPTNFASLQKQLRPVDDMTEVLKTPIPLATETFINKRSNSINLASGTSISVAGGFTLTVTTSGASVSGKTNFDNQKELQKAQDMAGALSALLRNAGGTMQNVAHSSAAYDKWTENVSKVMDYFGLDTSKDFTVNGMKYTKNEDGRFVSQAKLDAMTAYEQLKLANQTYEFVDKKTKTAISYISNYYLKTVPDSVVSAWNETLEETGINPFPEGYTGVLQQLSMEQDFLTGGNDNIFGNTVESSIEAVEMILERIDNPILKSGSDDVIYLESEKEFYTTLLSKIKGEESKGTGDVLGLTMLPYSDSISYGMSAFYSEKSTPMDPVIRINSNYGGKNRYFDIHVNEVDPNNASQLEMFALSCYMDEQGIVEDGNFGSYSRMKTYALNDSYLGQGIDLQNPASFSVQFDWVSMLQRMANEYMENSQTYSQYLDCNTLVTALNNWI